MLAEEIPEVRILGAVRMDVGAEPLRIAEVGLDFGNSRDSTGSEDMRESWNF